MRTALMLMCLCYVLWQPVSNGATLYPLLALLAAIAVSRFVTGERSVTKPFAIAAYLLVIAGLIGMLVGSLKGAPGLIQQGIVWFGGGVIWGLWAVSITRDQVRLILRTTTIATACLSGLIVLYVGAQQGLLPSIVPDVLLSSQGAGFDLTEDGSAIRLYGLSTLAAAGPLVSAALVAGKDSYLPSRRLLIVATVLAVVAGVLAGRRAIAAVTIVSPLLTYLLLRFLRPRVRTPWSARRPPKWLLASPVLIVLLAAMPSSWLERPLTAVGDGLHLFFSFGAPSGSAKSEGDTVRAQQGDELLAAWGDRPVFGHGLGAVLPNGFTRSSDRPWMFELQYHNLLFTSGLVGVGLVLVALICVGIGLRRAAMVSPEHVPVIAATGVAAVSMLIVNASNPYLQAVGHGWAVALVVGVANALSRPTREPVTPVPLAQASSTNLVSP